MDHCGKAVIVTGGDGYIGSHLSRHLHELGYRVITIDRDNSRKFGPQPPEIETHYFDLSKQGAVNEIIKILSGLPANSAVIHLAADKSVEESIHNPEHYYENNVNATQNVLRAMKEVGLKRLLFASTAALYAPTTDLNKVNEESPLLILNPYAGSKLISENNIRSNEFGEFDFTILRFFNVAGAGSVFLREKNVKNLIPEIFRAIQDNLVFEIYGADYPTADGTCVRDFIDVRDLIDAIAISLESNSIIPNGILNIGNGIGYSVLEVVQEIQRLEPRLKYRIVDRRVGDHSFVVADSSLAQKLLNWKPKHDLDAMIESVRD